MAGVSRRDFLQHVGGASAALTFMIANGITLDASPLGLPIGSQMWPHRGRIGTDGYDGLAAVLKDMKGIGIESVELVSPSGEFQALTDGKRVRKILDDNGIKSPSAHFRGVRTSLPTLIQWAHDIGMTHMSMASMSGPLVNNVTTLEAVKRTCEEYNKLGAIAKKEGLQMMTHNEGFENSRLNDGRLTYPVLLEYLDPDLMKMQFQMSSMATVGDPIMYFTMYPGRFASAHLQGVNTTAGMNPPRPTVLTVKPTPEQLAAQEAAQAARAGGAGRAAAAGTAPGGADAGRGRGGAGALAVGEDTVDWVKVFQAAKLGGLKNYFVEQNWETTVRSVAFLKTLNVT
jgi:sugar phosphate isomerase/epimerase